MTGPFQPDRSAEKIGPDAWRVTVTPPPWSGFRCSSITLTDNQYDRYREWLNGAVLIQDALPDLSLTDREILMTGIGPDQWEEEFGDDSDDNT